METALDGRSNSTQPQSDLPTEAKRSKLKAVNTVTATPKPRSMTVVCRERTWRSTGDIHGSFHFITGDRSSERGLGGLTFEGHRGRKADFSPSGHRPVRDVDCAERTLHRTAQPITFLVQRQIVRPDLPDQG